MNPSPFDFNEAREAINNAKSAQVSAEKMVVTAYQQFGLARKAYQTKLAETMLRLRADSDTPASMVAEVARGDKDVAELRYRKDVAEGVVEASRSAIWRHTADRKDLARLVDWSRRVAPDGQLEELAV